MGGKPGRERAEGSRLVKERINEIMNQTVEVMSENHIMNENSDCPDYRLTTFS